MLREKLSKTAEGMVLEYRFYKRIEFFLVLFSGLFFILAALLWVIVYVRNKENELKCCTLLVLGSGGHTAELLSFAGGLSAAYSPRVYVIAKTDQISEKKARCVEAERTKSARQPADFFVETLPRAREVGQSYVTSVFTTLIALLASIRVVLKHCPQLVICNGPGTCIPICFVAGFVQLLMRQRTALVFVESICRTQTLSLSGKILYYGHIARVIVQWPELLKLYPRAEYLGLLS